MTLDQARELLQVQFEFGGGYNRNGAHLIMAEVLPEDGAHAADQQNTSGRNVRLYHVYRHNSKIAISHHIQSI